MGNNLERLAHAHVAPEVYRSCVHNCSGLAARYLIASFSL